MRGLNLPQLASQPGSLVPFMFHMGSARLDTVFDFARLEVDVAVRCLGCRYTRKLRAEQLLAIFDAARE